MAVFFSGDGFYFELGIDDLEGLDDGAADA